MDKLLTNKPLLARAIFFKGDTEPLRDRLVWPAGNFLVVAKDETDEAPTWYNLDKIDRMEGVMRIREQPQTRLEQRITFF